MTTLRTPISAVTRTVLTAAAALLCAATLATALSPSFGGERGGERAIVDLPPVHIAARRADTTVAIAELPRVFVTGHRTVAANTVIAELPRVHVVARRTQEPAPIVVARQ